MWCDSKYIIDCNDDDERKKFALQSFRCFFPRMQISYCLGRYCVVSVLFVSSCARSTAEQQRLSPSMSAFRVVASSLSTNSVATYLLDLRPCELSFDVWLATDELPHLSDADITALQADALLACTFSFFYLF